MANAVDLPKWVYSRVLCYVAYKLIVFIKVMNYNGDVQVLAGGKHIT